MVTKDLLPTLWPAWMGHATSLARPSITTWYQPLCLSLGPRRPKHFTTKKDLNPQGFELIDWNTFDKVMMTSFPTIFHLWVAKIFSIHSSVGWMMPLCAGAWPNSNCPYCQQSNEKWHNFFSSAWAPVSHNSATSNSSALNNGSLAAWPPPSSPPVPVLWLTTGQTLCIQILCHCRVFSSHHKTRYYWLAQYLDGLPLSQVDQDATATPPYAPSTSLSTTLYGIIGTRWCMYKTPPEQKLLTLHANKPPWIKSAPPTLQLILHWPILPLTLNEHA